MKTVLSNFTKAVLLILFLFSLSSFNIKAIDSENQMDSVSIKKTAPQWTKNANIYEVNTRQYTPKGTFKAFQQNLPRLKAMGVNILWLMPINPIGEKNRKGTLGSYYSVKDYTAVNPEYGTEADFKNLVAETHKLGMHVIIDWVANHTSWDNVWIKPHSDWYTKDSLGNITIPKGTDWMDTADLNYDNPELRRAMIDAMKYWVKNADIDGFRCDVAGMVPITFWIHARKEIDALKPGCFFLAEDAEPKIYAAFDMTYDWPLKDLINDIAKGKANVSDLIAFFETESKRLNPENIRMQFITNHDENTWNGTEYERLGDAPVDPFTVLTYTIPGMPLTYSGQEEPLKRRLRFFDKDTINFRTFERKELITKLNQLKFKNTALLSNSYKSGFVCLKNSSPNVILSFVRQNKNSQVLCVFNFSDKEQRFKIQDELQVGFSKYIGENITVKNGFENKLKPWSYAIYLK